MLGRGSDRIPASKSRQMAIEAAVESLTSLATAGTGGTIAFVSTPLNGDTVTITDDQAAEVYEFLTTANLLGADNEVEIQATEDLTMAELVRVINLNKPTATKPGDEPQGVIATHVVVAGDNNDTLTLAPQWPGADGDATVATSAAARITVVSLSGGADHGSGDLAAIKAAVEALQAGLSDNRAPTITSKVNADAIVDTTSVDSVPLAASSTPYKQATVFARTVSADANTISTPNTDDVYILTTADDLRTAWGPLGVNQYQDLPDNCDLADFHLAVKVATEGVLIVYTV